MCPGCNGQQQKFQYQNMHRKALMVRADRPTGVQNLPVSVHECLVADLIELNDFNYLCASYASEQLDHALDVLVIIVAEGVDAPCLEGLKRHVAICSPGILQPAAVLTNYLNVPQSVCGPCSARLDSIARNLHKSLSECVMPRRIWRSRRQTFLGKRPGQR